ncbi:MAG: hypothetical protein M3Y08_11135 [Fibrobacterota bacterium]|nr:hypothetical protein [Fibrobacterota bacterium]
MTVRKLGPRILAAVLAAFSLSLAEFPIQDRGPRSLGIQYGLTFRGQGITSANVPSHETIHCLSLGYAPIPYLALEAGLGLDKLTIEQNKSVQFRGEYGFSPTFGLTLVTPPLLEILRLVGGLKAIYLNSEDERGFSYSGFISNPFLGAVVSPSGYFDIQAGGRLHLVDGTMRGPAGLESAFANKEIARGYLAFTLKSPSEKAFLTLDFELSPAIDMDWADGPREAAVGISFGTLLGWKSTKPETKVDSPYFQGFSEMKEKLKKMAEEVE